MTGRIVRMASLIADAVMAVRASPGYAAAHT